MIAIFVTFNIKLANLNQFMLASYGDAEGSVGNEPGCFRFDILKDKEVATRVHFYEVYKDQAAVDAHIKYPHYLNWRAEVEDYMTQRELSYAGAMETHNPNTNIEKGLTHTLYFLEKIDYFFGFSVKL